MRQRYFEFCQRPGSFSIDGNLHVLNPPVASKGDPANHGLAGTQRFVILRDIDAGKYYDPPFEVFYRYIVLV